MKATDDAARMERREIAVLKRAGFRQSLSSQDRAR